MFESNNIIIIIIVIIIVIIIIKNIRCAYNHSIGFKPYHNSYVQYVISLSTVPLNHRLLVSMS